MRLHVSLATLDFLVVVQPSPVLCVLQACECKRGALPARRCLICLVSDVFWSDVLSPVQVMVHAAVGAVDMIAPTTARRSPLSAYEATQAARTVLPYDLYSTN
jgi:hypothetical protein